MERSHPSSGRSATPADINRNGRPTSIGTGGRLQSECPADIIGIRSERITRPGAWRLDRILRSARAAHDDAVLQRVADHLDAGMRERLDALLTDDGEGTAFAQLAADPGRIGLESLLAEIGKLERLRALALPPGLLRGLHPDLVRRFRRRAGVETAWELRRHPERIRLPLLAFWCAPREAEVVDGLVELLIGITHRITVKAEERLTKALMDQSGKGERDYHARVVRSALQNLADGQSDVDAYIALVPPEERRMPYQGAEIGRRLLAAGRAAEALAVLEQARPKRSAAKAARDDDFYLVGHAADNEWEKSYIEALEATGNKDEAQRLRWAAFEERLSADQLRAYLKRLPDFDDVEAEERAMRHALGFRSFAAALGFFTGWPDQARAAQLVLARASEIDGNLYYLLDPAAQLIEGKHPLAATLLRRAMIEDTLDGAKSTRYKHAARHLLECRSLVAGIQDFGTFETHEAFVSRLRAKHSRKTGFWSQVSEVSEGQS